MKFAISAIVIGATILLIEIQGSIRSNYQYDKLYGSYWSLADKSSTIEKKSEYMDKFVDALDASGMSGNNAVFLKTPDNSFETNLQALKSLQSRLHEIKKMDIKSFEYQTAIQQITAQEQGEARSMLDVFQGVWDLNNFWYEWSWIALLISILGVAMVGSGIVAVGVILDLR